MSPKMWSVWAVLCAVVLFSAQVPCAWTARQLSAAKTEELSSIVLDNSEILIKPDCCYECFQFERCVDEDNHKRRKMLTYGMQSAKMYKDSQICNPSLCRVRGNFLPNGGKKVKTTKPYDYLNIKTAATYKQARLNLALWASLTISSPSLTFQDYHLNFGTNSGLVIEDTAMIDMKMSRVTGSKMNIVSIENSNLTFTESLVNFVDSNVTIRSTHLKFVSSPLDIARSMAVQGLSTEKVNGVPVTTGPFLLTDSTLETNSEIVFANTTDVYILRSTIRLLPGASIIVRNANVRLFETILFMDSAKLSISNGVMLLSDVEVQNQLYVAEASGKPVCPRFPYAATALTFRGSASLKLSNIKDGSCN